jgi:hypothetical protein
MNTFVSRFRTAVAVSLALATLSNAQAQTYQFQQNKAGLAVVGATSTPGGNPSSGSGGSNTTTPVAPSSGSGTATPAPAPNPAPTAAVQLTTASLAFPDTAVNTPSASAGVGVLSTGDAPLSLGAITASAPFSAVTDCTSSLGAPGQCTVNVVFKPTYPGPVSGTLTVPTSAGTKSVQLAGTGLGAVFHLADSPATNFTYPQTYVGSTQATVLSATYKNQGNIPGDLALPALTGANATDFSTTANCTGVSAGESCVVTVAFTPKTSGPKAASFSLSGWSAQLQGTAVAAPTKGMNFAGMINGATILNPTNINYFGPSPYSTSIDTNCANTSWYASSILCANNTVGTQSYPQSAATTWNNSTKGPRYVVLDLGTTRTFNAAYVYQSPSDGRFTGVQLAVSNSPLAYADANWTVVAPEMTVSDTVYTPQRMGFGDVSGRYVRVMVRHAGTTYPNYVEIRGLQLFYE